jgi:hypothetical protein
LLTKLDSHRQLDFVAENLKVLIAQGIYEEELVQAYTGDEAAWMGVQRRY